MDESTQTTRRAPMRYFAALWIVIATISLLATGYVFWSRSDDHRFAVLAAAAPPQRTFEGRLTGFPYRSFHQNTTVRGSTAAASLFEDRQNLSFVAACNQVLATTARSPADYHLVGIANLVSGDSDKAIAALERALVIATGIPDPQRATDVSKDFVLLTDLSAAYLGRGNAQKKALDVVRALNCADRAWRLRRTPETSWNRALALQRLHLGDDAREAWSSYLRTEHSSQWAADARTRLAATSGVTESALWSRDASRLHELPIDRIKELAERFPLPARRAAEKDLLPTWAEAILDGQKSQAASVLDRVEAIGATLKSRSGEALAYDVAQNLRTLANNRGATMDVARAIASVASAKTAYDQSKGAECRAKLRSAIPALLRNRNPFLHYARFYVAASYYFDNDYASLREEAAKLSDIPSRYMALRAQTSWITGLGEMSVGRPDGAVPHYEAALGAFTRLGESDFVASVHNLLAEAYDYLDSPDEAWRHRDGALEIASGVGLSSSNFGQLLQQGAQLLLDMHQPAVAKILLDRSLQLPASNDDPLFIVDTICWQAVALRQLGRTAAADAAWQRALGAASKISTEGLRSRTLNDITLTRALTSEPVTASEMRRAVEFARTSDNRWALPRLLRLQGDVLARQDMYTEAMTAYSAAVDEIIAQRGHASLARYELLNRTCLADATERALSLALKHRDYETAIRFSEHSAGAAFPERKGSTVALIPANVAVIKIVCVADRMLIRTITARGSSDREVAAHLESVRAVGDASSTAPVDAARLGRIFIGSAVGAGVDTLVFVPDAATATIQFESLIDPGTGKALVERFDVAQSPTVGAYLRAGMNAGGRALLVDGSEPRDLPLLPEAAEEIRDIRRLYSSAVVLKSDTDDNSSFSRALSDAGLIHIAAHGLVDRANEQLSTLVFGATNVVYAHDIAAANLSRHPIVVLSACSGADTAPFRRRRAPTFADAFLAAGASAVVASTAPIEDQRAHRFSRLLHERLSRGMRVGHAVREIQLIFAREGKPWADLIVVGDPSATFKKAS